jgi:hypothetical protein
LAPARWLSNKQGAIRSESGRNRDLAAQTLFPALALRAALRRQREH